MDLDKLSEKLPDIYFDWYARLLPGIAAMGVYVATGPGEEIEFWAEHWGIAVMTGYVAGHFAQPPASLLVRRLEEFFALRSFTGALSEQKAKVKERDKLIANAPTSLPGLWSKASKAHAEGVSMITAGVLIFVVLLFRSHILFLDEAIKTFIVLFLFAVERASSYERKVRKVADAMIVRRGEEVNKAEHNRNSP